MKKILALLLSIIMLLSLVSAAAFAQETGGDEGEIVPLNEPRTGDCGENTTWTLDDYGNLVISGTGAIDDDAFNDFEYRADVMSVTIESGVTVIGASAFEGCSALTSVTIPASVTSVGVRAFGGCDYLTTVTYVGAEEQMNALRDTIAAEGENNELLAADWSIAQEPGWESVKYTGSGTRTNFVDTVYLNAQDTTYLNIVIHVNTNHSDGDFVPEDTGKFVLNYGGLDLELPLADFDTSYDETEMKVALARYGYYGYVDSRFYTIRLRVYPNHMRDVATIRLYNGETQVTLYRNTGGQVFGSASWSSAGYELWSLEDGYSTSTYEYLVSLQSSSVFGNFATKMIAYGEAARAIEQWN